MIFDAIALIVLSGMMLVPLINIVVGLIVGASATSRLEVDAHPNIIIISATVVWLTGFVAIDARHGLGPRVVLGVLTNTQRFLGNPLREHS